MVMEAELADGTILEFPNGTPPEVVQATVRRLVSPSAAPQQTTSGESPPAPEPGFLERARNFLGIKPVSDAEGREAASLSPDYDPREFAKGLGNIAAAAGQGATLNFGDEIVAGLQSALTDKPYDQAVDNLRAAYRLIPEDQRIFGETLGALGSVAATGGAAPAIRAASVIPRIAKTAGISGIVGGTSAFGGGEGGLEERLSGVPLATALSAGLGLGGGLLERGLERSREAIRRGGERFRQAAAEGVPLTAGQAFDSPTLQLLEAGVARTPGGASTLTRFADRQRQAQQDALTRSFVEGGKPLDAVEAGNRLRAGAQRALKDAEDQFEAGYSRLYQQVPAETAVPVNSIVALQQDLTGRAGQNPAIASILSPVTRQVDLLLSGAENGAIPFGTLRTLRTTIGRAIRGASDDIRPELQRLYGSITDDINTAVKANPEGAQLLSELDGGYRQFQSEIRPRLTNIIDRNPEDAFRLLQTSLQRGGSDADVILGQLPAEIQAEVRGAALNELGRTTRNADFSPDRFARQLDALPQQARAAALGPQQEAVERANAAAQLASEGKRFGNPSGTTQTAVGVAGLSLPAYQALAGDLGGAATTLGALYGAPYVAGRALTSQQLLARLLREPISRQGPRLTDIERTALATALAEQIGTRTTTN